MGIITPADEDAIGFDRAGVSCTWVKVPAGGVD